MLGGNFVSVCKPHGDNGFKWQTQRNSRCSYMLDVCIRKNPCRQHGGRIR